MYCTATLRVVRFGYATRCAAWLRVVMRSYVRQSNVQRSNVSRGMVRLRGVRRGNPMTIFKNGVARGGVWHCSALRGPVRPTAVGLCAAERRVVL